MNIVVTSPCGESLRFEAFVACTIVQIQHGGTKALAVLQHAHRSKCAPSHPVHEEVAGLMTAMLAEPHRAKELTNAASSAACCIFGMCLSLAYSEVEPGAATSMLPESGEDEEFLAQRLVSFHRSPATLQ